MAEAHPNSLVWNLVLGASSSIMNLGFATAWNLSAPIWVHAAMFAGPIILAPVVWAVRPFVDAARRRALARVEDELRRLEPSLTSPRP